MSFFRLLRVSVLLHILLIGAAFQLLGPPIERKIVPRPVVVSFENSATAPASGSGGSNGKGGSPKKPALNLRPDFFSLQASRVRPSEDSGSASLGSESDRRAFLETDGKLMSVFDGLAHWIDHHLEYPETLVEHGVEGIASLELHFDSNGEVDESRSQCFGANRVVRGLLIQAVRTGLTRWFASEAKRLDRNQFRNQHFRADFIVSGVLGNQSEMSKQGVGRYQFTRRRYRDNCIAGIAPTLATAAGIGVSASCLVRRAVGSIRDQVDGKYASRFIALKDRLERLDQLGLSGINLLIRGG